MSPLETDYFEVMTQLVTISRYTGDDSWGNPTYGISEQFRCRIDNLNTAAAAGPVRDGTMTDPNKATTSIITDYVEPPFTVRDKVVLPDGRVPTITTVAVDYDERGPHHITISAEETRE